MSEISSGSKKLLNNMSKANQLAKLGTVIDNLDSRTKALEDAPGGGGGGGSTTKQYLVNRQAQVDQIFESNSGDKGLSIFGTACDGLSIIPNAGLAVSGWRENASPPVGHKNYYRVEVTTASAPSSDAAVLSWALSGNEMRRIHENGGTFKVKFRCNIAGKYSLLGANALAPPVDRIVLQSFDYLVAGVWQDVEFKFNAETTETGWNFGNGHGLSVSIIMDADPAISIGVDSPDWLAFTSNFASTGQVGTWADTIGNYVEVTGWSLFEGDNDEYSIPSNSFWDDLVECQRYIQKSYRVGDKTGLATTDAIRRINWEVGGAGQLYVSIDTPLMVGESNVTGIVRPFDAAGTANKASGPGGDGLTTTVETSSNRITNFRISANTVGVYSFHWLIDRSPALS
jgi:hypothetical protein